MAEKRCYSLLSRSTPISFCRARGGKRAERFPPRLSSFTRRAVAQYTRTRARVYIFRAAVNTVTMPIQFSDRLQVFEFLRARERVSRLSCVISLGYCPDPQKSVPPLQEVIGIA